MKKRKFNILKITALIFMIVISCIFSVAPVNAASTLKDYDDISSLATKYSYGTLFYTEDTEIQVLEQRWSNSDSATIASNWNIAWGADEGDVIKVKITNCAIDEDGDMCDVIFTVDNVKKYAITETESVMGGYKNFFPNVSFAAGERIVANMAINNIFEIADKNDPGSSNTTKYSATNPGDLIALNLETNCGRADFTLDYYKAGTSQKANINGSIAIIYDLDVTNWSGEGDSELFGGQEGVLSLYDGETYYDKGSAVEARDGGVSAIRGSNNTNGLAKKSSVFLVQNEKATFKMRYGGTGCGILYSFVSPYAYDVENPTISVDKTRVYEGETFTYSVNQYVPNNYYSKYLNFFDNYNGMYSSLKIEDTVNSYLTINGNVKVVNESGSDVTSYFDITTSGNKVTATLKSAYLESIDFYSHLYTLKIPVKYNNGAGKSVSSVSNNATRTIVTNGTQNVKTTNNVDVGLKYDVKTIGTISNGTVTINNNSTITSITDTTTANHGSNVNTVVKFKPDKIYELESVTVNGTAIDINTLNKNSSGEYEYTFSNNNINQNIEQKIVITTSLIKTSLTGTKNWTDDNDKLGFRPDSYTLKLYADDVYMKEATFTTNNWYFNDLVKYNTTTEEEVKYTVQEDNIIINSFDKYIGIINGTVVENKLVRTPSTVIVKYVDQNGNKLAEEVLLNGFGGENYTTSRKDVDGYRAFGAEPANANGTYAATSTTVTYVYERIPATLKVNYIDKTTGGVIVTETISGYVYDTKTTAAKDLGGYTLIEKPSKEEYTLTEDEQVVNYYYSPNTKVIVKHLDQFDNSIEVAPEETIEGYVGKEYTTSKSDNHTLPNYTYVSSTSNVDGKMTKETTIITYYYVKGLKINVRYVDKITNQDIDVSKNEVTSKNQGQAYTTTKKEFENYVWISDTQNTAGTVGNQDIEVIYYYSPVTTVLVKHLDKYDHSIEVATSQTIDGYIGKEYTTNVSSSILPNYVYSDSTSNTTGNMTREQIVVEYYYIKESEVRAKYIDENTGKQIDNYPDIVGTYKEATTYTTNKLQIPGYTFTKIDGSEKGVVGKDNIVVTYYYKKNSAGIEVKYIDQVNKNEIATPTYQSGLEKDPYKTEAKNIAGYELVTIPNNANGEMTVDKITVVYEYRLLSDVTAKYIDENTNQEIIAAITNTYKEGDAYSTEKKAFDEYTFTKVTGNTSGTVARENIVVTYYYKKIASGIEAKYIDQATGAEIADSVVKVGLEKDPYTTEAKDIDGYILVKIPSNQNGEMTVNKITVIYEYRKLSDVTAKYIDENTNQEIVPTILNTYKEGDSYSTEKKVFDGYALIKVTGNTSGIVAREDIEVTYYYKKNTGIIINHIDKYEKSIVLKNETRNGLEGDSYTTSEEKFKGYVYAQEVEGKANGKMEAQPLTITYYYIKQSNLITEHIDAISGEKIIADVITTYDEKENYTAFAQDLPGYVLVEEPDETEGIMGREDVIKTFKYKKISAGLVVKYVDEITKEQLEQKEYNGNENDIIDLEELTFDGYILTKRPAVSQITLTVNGQETYFYYKKIVDLEVVGIDKNTGAEIYSKVQSGVEGAQYTTKPLEIPGYELVEEPDNKDGIYNRDNPKVVYVYKQIAQNVIVRYIDKDTNEVLDKYEINGYVGDEYTTEQKEFEDYNFVKVIGNSKGTLNDEPQEVNYYYEKKEGKVVVIYEDINGDILLTEEHTGKVKDEYSIEEKTFDNYRVVERPENTTGKYIDGTIELKYVLEKVRGKIKVNFVDREGNILFESVLAEGDIDEEFYLEALEKEGYIIAENAKIQINYIDGEIVIDVVYEKIEEPPVTSDMPIAIYITIVMISILSITINLKNILKNR